MTPQLTGAGKNILMRALAGETIVFTKIQLGNGPAQAPATATALQNPLLTVPLNDIEIGEAYVTLVALFTNSSVVNGFHVTEAGFFVQDPDNENQELLYALGSESESSADFIPARDNRILEMRYDALVFIGDAENVTAAINGSLVYATKSEFDAHTADTSNPHGVTKAQVGLGNVPNVTTNNQTPTFNDAGPVTNIVSGETLSTIFGKIRAVFHKVLGHLLATNNPHGVTAEQTGAAAQNHTHSATDINSGLVSPARGGTGLANPSKGGLLIGGGPDSMTVIRGIGAVYSPITGEPHIGTLPEAMGGTGVTTLAALANNLTAVGLTRIQTGTYLGNGNYGADAANRLQFSVAPKLLIVMQRSENSNNPAPGFMAINGVSTVAIGGDDLTRAGVLHFTWQVGKVMWYGASARYQQNTSGEVYRYIALL